MDKYSENLRKSMLLDTYYKKYVIFLLQLKRMYMYDIIINSRQHRRTILDYKII